jgi:hypothetical protein
MKQNPEDEFVNVTEPRNRFRQAGNKSLGWKREIMGVRKKPNVR